MIDTGTTLILAPRAAAKAIFELIPGAFPLFGDDYSDQTFFAYPCSMPSNYMPALQFAGKSFGINSLDFNFGVLTSAFARLIGNETMAIELEIEVESGAAKTELETGDLTEASCVAAIVGTDVDPQENLYVVGDAFLKNWYSTFNYVNANGGPSVSFAAAI